MRIFDAHVHVDTRGYEDLHTMALFGTEAVVTCAHDFFSFSCARSVLDHFDRLLTFDRKRLERNLITPFVALGIHPRGIPREGWEEVVASLPAFLERKPVVAVGEIGLDYGGEDEVEVFCRQIEIAQKLRLPSIVHTPGREKVSITGKVIEVLSRMGVDWRLILIDHVSEATIDMVKECGAWVGLSVHPTKLSATAAARLIEAYGGDSVIMNSDVAGAASDVLALPKAIWEMRGLGISIDTISKVVFDNARELYRVEI
ncbi:MAG: TatD family hydrolase [Chloroflexi bacterium]|nr:TatD family hydrolase [Chloroflexota bacterium]